MSVPQHVTLLTLGVADLARARAFYIDGLGWSPIGDPEGVVFVQAGHGLVLALWGAGELAEDAGVPGADEGPAGGRFSLAHNVGTPEDVDAFYDLALAAGATQLVRPRKVFWGGYSGYFADPDGFWWEVAHNPFMAAGPDGAVTM